MNKQMSTIDSLDMVDSIDTIDFLCPSLYFVLTAVTLNTKAGYIRHQLSFVLQCLSSLSQCSNEKEREKLCSPWHLFTAASGFLFLLVTFSLSLSLSLASFEVSKHPVSRTVLSATLAIISQLRQVLWCTGAWRKVKVTWLIEYPTMESSLPSCFFSFGCFLSVTSLKFTQ